MRIGISTWVWGELIGRDDVAIIERAHALGFAGLEIAVLQRDPFDLTAVDAALKRTGVMPIISTAFPEERDLVHANPEYQRNGRDFLRYCVDVAVKLGADRIIGPFCAAPGRLWMAGAAQKQQEFERAVNNLRSVAAYAHEHGVRLALEVLNRYESSFINTANDGMHLVEAVGNPAFGLLLDTFHMHIEEKSVAAAIARAGPHLHHVHAIENDRGIPGSGQVDWAGLGDALHHLDYHGWIVIEGFSDKVDWLARAISMWRPLAPDMNQLAREGLAFLQATFAVRGAR